MPMYEDYVNFKIHSEVSVVEKNHISNFKSS